MSTYKQELADRKAKIAALADLLKMTSGDLTDEVRSTFAEQYGKTPGGPLVSAARRLLGIAPPVKGTPRSKANLEPPVPAEMREALNMMAAVERLQRKQAGIEVEIEAKERELASVKAEIEIYKPALGHLRALASAVQGVRTKIQQGGVAK